MRICKYCGANKPIEQFNTYSHGKYRRWKCSECEGKQHKLYYNNNRKRLLELAHIWNVDNKIKRRNKRLERVYNITGDEYDLLIKNQNGKCAICLRKPRNNRPLCVDHNHLTNKNRELLCDNCNITLGLIKEDICLLENIINYLKEHNI